MADYIYAVNQATGEFVYGGHPAPYDVEPGLSPDQIRVVTNRAVDKRTEKWGGSAIISKSAAEITAYDDAIKEQRALRIDVDAALQAVAQLDFEERQKLQVKNGETLRTAAECKARIRLIYRSLI